MIYVLYHGKCYDGFGSAFAAWKKLGDTAKYIPVSYGSPAPLLEDAERIYILDFSYDKDTLLEYAKGAKVVVLDHHKTAQEALQSFQTAGNPYAIFDMNKSGALLSWIWFHGQPVPDLIKHISDRDLWKFELDGSAKIHKALVSLPMDFEVWDKLDCEVLKREGVVCERLYTKLVENICEAAFLTDISGYTVPVVNTSIAWSEIGAKLLEIYQDAPFVASFTVFEKDVMWSLRSKGEFDVSAIAKGLGGGGHKNAAGFKAKKKALEPAGV